MDREVNQKEFREYVHTNRTDLIRDVTRISSPSRIRFSEVVNGKAETRAYMSMGEEYGKENTYYIVEKDG